MDNETRVVILSNISGEWLHHHCPKYFQGKLPDNESQSSLNYFLDVSLNLPTRCPEYENFQEKKFVFIIEYRTLINDDCHIRHTVFYPTKEGQDEPMDNRQIYRTIRMAMKQVFPTEVQVKDRILPKIKQAKI